MTSTEEDLQRIRDRYPARPGRHRFHLLLGALLAAILLGWTAWAGWKQANPPVIADVYGFRIPSDSLATARLRVQRTDPSRAAVCTLKATAESFVRVGELEAPIPPGTQKITLVDVDVRTLHRATTVTVESCRTA